jgi:hypothetical protein
LGGHDLFCSKVDGALISYQCVFSVLWRTKSRRKRTYRVMKIILLLYLFFPSLVSVIVRCVSLSLCVSDDDTLGQSMHASISPSHLVTCRKGHQRWVEIIKVRFCSS